jgi:hypothetical protein
MTEQEQRRTLRNDPDSLAPVALDRLSVEEETALMNRGRGARLVGAGALLALCGVGLAFWLGELDTKQKYADALEQSAAAQQQHVDPYLACALPGLTGARPTTPDDLKAAIERVQERQGRSYSRTLARCAPLLAELGPALAALTVPQDVQSQLSDLKTAARAHERAWSAYRVHLTEVASPDSAGSREPVENVAHAWADYEQKRALLEAALKVE